jgi:hypothetical protein
MKKAMSASQAASRVRSSLRCGSMAERSFTPDEANNALSEVRPVAERLVALRTRMRELEQAQGELVTAIGGNGGGYAASDLNAAQSWHVGEESVAFWHGLEDGYAGRKPIDWDE